MSKTFVIVFVNLCYTS